MRYLVLFTFFLFCTSTSFADDKETDKTATFIKIWGFLKYHHSTVAEGKLDWDETFRTGLRAIKLLKSKKELNDYYLGWIEKLGKIEKCGSCKIEKPDTEKFNLDMGWLIDSTNFDNELILKLTYIQQNRNQRENYYVGQVKGAGNPDFKNEKIYKDSIYPSPELRLLTLARYWNIINYFFPYRYQTDQNWNLVLNEMIPKFRAAQNITAYHLAILELTAKIDDSHAKFSTLHTVTYFGLKWVPFKINIIDNKAVVTGFFNDSLSKAYDIRIGDVFEKIEGRSIEQHMLENGKYIGASNPSVKKRDIHTILFHGNTPTVETEFERNGVIAKKIIPRVNFNQLGYVWGQDNPKDTVKLLSPEIGYVHMGNLVIKQVPALIAQLKDTKAIIFDVRNYPRGTLRLIADFLNNKPTAFVKATIPDPKHPGTFTFDKDIFCGKNNPNYYKGKVILLCNENTQSHAEFTIMALQTAPNVTVVGSQTSGADGNVSLITLPGDFKTYMTGLGVYYPDGRETQRIGIVPDVVVNPTIQGIRANRDEVLEKAIELIKEK